MKKIISIGLILLMSAQSVYKLGVITYFQLNRDFISEFLCIKTDEPIAVCHGQCFLEAKLGLAEETPQSDMPPASGKQKIEFPTFIVFENICEVRLIIPIANGDTGYIRDLSSTYFTSVFHPPTIG